ncbi:hypothetical protein ABZZ20_29025 [Streptomyces sp. NPDC006430]|uniref:hypothetical protein n=1 Tax=Streptomyces sp. NPDC006430 TaxID=3154299 RepID=UPI0033A5CCBC
MPGDHLHHVLAIGLGKHEVERVPSGSGLTLGFDTVETKQVGKNGQLIIRKQAGHEQPADITVVRGMDKSPAFTDWVKKTLAE